MHRFYSQCLRSKVLLQRKSKLLLIIICGDKSADVTGRDAQSGLGQLASGFQGGTHPEGFRQYFRQKVTTQIVTLVNWFSVFFIQYMSNVKNSVGRTNVVSCIYVERRMYVLYFFCSSFVWLSVFWRTKSVCYVLQIERLMIEMWRDGGSW